MAGKKRSLWFKLLLVFFAFLCFGTLFAVSASFVDTLMVPKWHAFFCGASAIILTLAFSSFRPKWSNICSEELGLLFLILITFCLAQAIYGVLQFAHILAPYGSHHRITGSFENPAGFAACLCTGIPFAFYFLQARRTFVRYYAVVAITVIAVSVALSFSRTGILNLAVMASIALFVRARVRHKAKIGIGLIVLLVVISSVLYFVKKDSADGRLLIWRCSIEMIKDKPMLGHGPGGFTANYMNYQAEYFKQHPDSKYAMLAGNVHHPFNEYILLLINYGLVGFVLFLALLYWIWTVYRKRYKDDLAVRVAGWSLCSILLFSFFSYPFSYPFVWVVGLMSLAVIIKGKLISNRIVGTLLIVTAAIASVLTSKDIYYQLRWREVSLQAIDGHTVKVLPEYSQLLKTFGYNRYFLYNYAYELQNIKRYSESIDVANRCNGIWADYYLQLMIADNYYLLEQYDASEQHFKQAGAMCPVRFMPLYRLAKLYRETGQIEESKALARQILNKEVKIPSTTINAIKYEMRKYLQ